MSAASISTVTTGRRRYLKPAAAAVGFEIGGRNDFRRALSAHCVVLASTQS